MWLQLSGKVIYFNFFCKNIKTQKLKWDTLPCFSSSRVPGYPQFFAPLKFLQPCTLPYRYSPIQSTSHPRAGDVLCFGRRREKRRELLFQRDSQLPSVCVSSLNQNIIPQSHLPGPVIAFLLIAYFKSASLVCGCAQC